LGGVEFFGAGAKEALLESGNDFVFTGVLGFEGGEFFLKRVEALEKFLNGLLVVACHYGCSSRRRANFGEMWCFFGDLCGAFVPGLEAGAAEVDAVEKELEGLGLELDALLGGLAGFGPAEAAFFEAFDGDPEAGAVEVEEFDASAIFVGEDKEGVVGGLGLVVAGGEFSEAVKGFAHIAWFEGEEDFEGGGSEVDHGRPPSCELCVRRALMKSQARGKSALDSMRMVMPWVRRMTRRGTMGRGHSISMKSTLVHRRRGLVFGVDMRAG
jgi:hypothetical protein